MASFTDHYNAIYAERFLWKLKNGKDYWDFNDSLLCKPAFSTISRPFFFLLETHKHIQKKRLTLKGKLQTTN